MSTDLKRTLNDLTNESKRLKNDSAIDLNFDIGEIKHQQSHSSSESLFEDDSIFDDDVFEDEPLSSSKLNQSQGRKRLNGTSSYRMKENKPKRKSQIGKKDNRLIDQTLNQLREEQARIDAHSLSILSKRIIDKAASYIEIIDSQMYTTVTENKMHLHYEQRTIRTCQRFVICICILVATIFFLYFLFQYQRVNSLWTPVHVWYTPEQRIKRPTYVNHDHGFCGPCPTHKLSSDAWRLIDLVQRLAPRNPFLINIGAASNYGGRYDPTYPVLTSTNSTFGALLIDPNPNPSLFSGYPNRTNIRITHDYVWTETIIPNIFERYNISKQFTILKVDIDSYECSVLESILQAGYRPQLIHTEFNPVFPPPVIFKPIYNPKVKNDWKPELWASNSPFYGCSLTALSQLLLSFDYILVEVDFWDVIYIERELVRSLGIQIPVNDQAAYEYGFLGHSCFPYCRENVKLYNNQIESAIRSTINQSNFTNYMKTILDSYAPISIKTKSKHPYEITV
ncbi:unnamed protein product [Adineta ricciae]|uniref:Uncharacterized protein n=2 Tax=Adineta ricciae TaxID=249248 RepID=A0A814CYK7_ADIRI|nr:unnamed protein product [Adineta ricciae]